MLRIKVVTASLKDYEDPDNAVIDEYQVGLSTIFITRDGRYLIQDPPVTPFELREAERRAEDLLFTMPDDIVSNSEALDRALAEVGIRDERIAYLLKREILGYSALDPAVRDPYVEDIQVPGPNTPTRITHSVYGPLISNVVFTEEELDRLTERLVHLCGKSISVYQPMLSTRLPEGHRLTVTYKREVGHRGSSLTIRKFPERPWSITMMLLKETLNPLVAAWLMMLIERRKALLVVGTMGTGKTSMINALANMIPERATIVTIEDTPELRLAHPYWIPLVTRDPVTIDERGAIDMFKLVKHALRLSADYIIIGEVRGEEARIWANALLSGHGGITSFHAESPEACLQRLVAEPLNVERGALTALRCLVMLRRMPMVKEDERGVPRKVFLRRVVGVFDVDVKGSRARIYRLFKYDPASDSILPVRLSLLAKTPTARLILEEAGWDEDKLIDELLLRAKFLAYLAREASFHEELLDYREVTRLMWRFYENPKSFRLDKVDVSVEGHIKPQVITTHLGDGGE